MRYAAYLRVVAQPAVVQSLHEELRWPQSSCQAPREVGPPSGKDWQWHTEPVGLVAGGESAGIEALLVEADGRRLQEAIRVRAAAIRFASLVVVCRYGDTETGDGLYLGPRAIALMAKIGLDLDYDLSRTADS